jgi:hypothetical protein
MTDTRANDASLIRLGYRPCESRRCSVSINNAVFQLPMDQLPFDPPKRARGGDTRTPQAKVDIARRENQIVELRLRNISFAAIGRAVGVSKAAAIKAFYKALRRNTDQDIQSHHRSELAKLEMEETRLCRRLRAALKVS